MHLRAIQRFRHLVERFIVRGAFAQLLVVASAILVISLLFGVLEFRFSSGEKRSLFESIWWAFLRLTDPGYLGDDSGVVSRTFSTILTVLGYMVFMGSLVAILTQWLNRTLKNLESGITPIARDQHILVAGSQDPSELVVKSLFESSGRARRFLERRGAQNLHVVMLSERAGAELRSRLKNSLGPHWDSRGITMRLGVAWNNEHLVRVDFAHASVVILPAEARSSGCTQNGDNETIKTLFSISQSFGKEGGTQLPRIVVEMRDDDRQEALRAAYRGPVHALAGSKMIARLIACSVEQPGLTKVLTELIRFNEGNELYLRDASPYSEHNLDQLRAMHHKAMVLGTVPKANSTLQRKVAFRTDRMARITDDELIVYLAPNYEDTDPPRIVPSHLAEAPARHVGLGEHEILGEWKRILILGWNSHLPAIVEALVCRATLNPPEIHISYLPNQDSKRSVSKRRGFDLPPESNPPTIHELDNTLPRDLKKLKPETFSQIIILSSGWLDDEDRADSRAIVTLLNLEKLLTDSSLPLPNILVEMQEPTNAELVETRVQDILASTEFTSQLLAQIAIRPEIQSVYESLLEDHGPCIAFVAGSDRGIVKDQLKSFRELQALSRQHGELLLGIFRNANKETKLILNAERDSEFRLGLNDRLIVLRG